MSVVPYGWWVQYVRQLWGRFQLRPHRILDVACGTGSVLAELLRLGYEAEGTDLSAEMLRVAARKVPKGTPLWEADASDLHLPTPPFDACVCLFDSLNYITEPEKFRAALAGVYRHLKPGGSFVFDMNAVRALETGMFDQNGIGQDDRLSYEWRSAWDARTRLCVIQMEFRVYDDQDEERVFHETHVQRGYTLPEIRDGLEAAGFEPLGIFDAFTLRPPIERTDRYHIIAQRPETAPE
jgi:ubiquinone/menaquinone biosynthesis C-methylase UbiE